MKPFPGIRGAEVLRLFSELPAGVIPEEGYTHDIKTNSDVKGIKAYAPLHEYELQGKGAMKGGVNEIFEIYRRAQRIEVVKLGVIELTFG